MHYVGVLGLALFIGCAGAAVGQPTTSEIKSVAGERLSADTPLTTASGATFTAPLGWSVISSVNKVVLAPPEEDSRLVLVDVHATDVWRHHRSRSEPNGQPPRVHS